MVPYFQISGRVLQGGHKKILEDSLQERFEKYAETKNHEQSKIYAQRINFLEKNWNDIRSIVKVFEVAE